MKLLALDCETTGLLPDRGVRPFQVTTCSDDGTVRYWVWDVCPRTRTVSVPPGDLNEIADLVASADELVFHNSRYDVKALASVGFFDRYPRDELWAKTHDTLLAAHLLRSNGPKDLTSLSISYLGVNCEPLEKALEHAVKGCRRQVQLARVRVALATRKREKLLASPVYPAACDADPEGWEPPAPEDFDLAAWRIADEDDPDLPSNKGGKDAWRSDYWLPRAYAKWAYKTGQGDDNGRGWRSPGTKNDSDPGHPYWTVLDDYANSDSQVTVGLWSVLRAKLEQRGLWAWYLDRRKLLPVADRIESGLVTFSRSRADGMRRAYAEEAEDAARTVVNIARSCGHELTIGKAMNGSLRTFLFDVLGLEPRRGKKSKTDAPAFDKGAKEHHLLTLPPNGKAYRVVDRLDFRQKRLTAVGYLDAYARFGIPLSEARGGPFDRRSSGVDLDLRRGDRDFGRRLSAGPGGPAPDLSDWLGIHPGLNPVGTHTLRWSHRNPNTGNLSKQEERCRKCGGEGKDAAGGKCPKCGGTGKNPAFRSARYAFGPAPGREWWSLDAKNIELRLPAYESGQREVIALFEEPDAPPFYGSNHLLYFSIVYPDVWEKAVREVGLEKAGPYCKKTYKDTYYQWCKNGDFAIQYQAGRRTADAAYHRPGAYDEIKGRLSSLTTLNERCVRFADRHGYVETIPRRSVDPRRGYPLVCPREGGTIKPTLPLSYRVQGSAMDWTNRAMIEVDALFAYWFRETAGRPDPFDGRVVLQVHDEIVVDLPERTDPRADPKRSNLGRVREIAEAMAAGGSDFVVPVPTPVGIEYHANNWAEGTVFQ